MSATLTEKLKEGNVLGGWCTFTSFASAEIMAGLGYDFLIFDLQHGEATAANFPTLLGALKGTGVESVVRVPQNNYHGIHWCFDQGFSGVLVPTVNTAAEARAAVAAAKFPPLGQRSFGPYRAAAYGANVREYMATADARSTLILQIESEEAVSNLDEILGVPGIDAIHMGPNDLAFSLLKPGDSVLSATAGGAAGGGPQNWTAFARTPRVLEICDEVRTRAKAAGIPFGMTAGTRAEAREWLQKGASFVTYGSDFGFLRSGAETLLGPRTRP